MKKFAGLILLVSCYGSFAQKKPAAPVITRYIPLTGTIDKYPVTFHLYRINDDFSGHYYYNNTEVPIDFSGKMDKARFLNLSHLDDNEKNNEEFAGIFKDSVYSGTWSYKGKVMAFRVTHKKDNSLPFDYICTSGEKKLSPKPEYGPEDVSYEAATIWPAAGFPQPAADSLKRFIRNSFGVKNSTDEIGKILIAQKNEMLNPKEKPDEIIGFSSSNVIQVVYINPQIISFSQSSYSYTGGAHGNYGTSYTSFDLVNNKELYITDVLTDTSALKETFATIFEKKFRATYTSMISSEEKLSEVLFEDKIPINDNFLLTGKGITFHYVPYEIAAYAFGEISLYIPYKEILPHLKPEFKKLMGL